MQKLSFEQFVETIQKRIGSCLPKDYEGAQIELRHVTKNNNVTLTGLNICLPGSHVTPSIYLEYFFDSYMKEDLNIDEILQKIVEMRINNSVPPEEFNLDELLDFNFTKVRNRIYPKLVNRDDFNHDYLMDKPFMVIANLACIYQIDVGHNGDMATITISDGILHNWRIHLDELHDIAIENMKRDRPSVFIGMSEVLKELTGGSIPPLTDTGEMMWILTNKDKYAGAANVLDTDMMEEICEKFDNKFMIIPSSIHELIIIPSEGVDPYNILEMISEVNGSEVRPEEVLSNDLYMYDRKNKTIVKF